MSAFLVRLTTLLLVLAAGRPAAAAPPAAAAAVAAPGDASPAQLERWLDSVVLLVNGPAFCSGVVVGEDGLVATAYHCVSSGLRTRVRTRDGREGIARVVATAPREDLALIRAPELAGAVPPLPVREDTPLRGERVYGMGHPYAPAADRSAAMEGMLLWSVTEGIVSAVGPRLIQTDAALNPGNSGGPVVDARGRIVGITSRKLSGDNIAFLASAAVLRELLDHPRRSRFLGGEFFSGLSLIGGDDAEAAQSIEVIGQAIVRDRVILGLAMGVPLQARMVAMERGRAWYPSYELTVSLRQRFGRGVYSTTLDAIGGVAGIAGLSSSFDAADGTWLILPDLGAPFVPAVGGRLGMGGGAIRLVALLDDPASPTWLLGVDLDLPGVVGTF